MRNFVVLGKVEARVVTAEARLRLDVAAAKHALRQKDIDEAIDIERNVGRHMGRIDGNNQIGPDALGLQDLRELHRAKAAHGVPDQNDRRGIFAILADRLGGDQAANGELVDVGRDAGLFEPFPQTVDAARKERTKRPTEQVSPPAARLRRRDRGRR